MSGKIVVKNFGTMEYAAAWLQMRRFTENRDAQTADEIWLLQHPPIFTLGLSASESDILRISDIPIARSDRGGKVTYHGPGQIVAYLLIDIRRRKIGARRLVRTIEKAAVSLLADCGISACGDETAPGVYADGKKIAALGLKISRGATYHGLALNVKMDLSPFADINPCGIVGLKATQIADFFSAADINKIAPELAMRLIASLNSAGDKIANHDSA